MKPHIGAFFVPIRIWFLIIFAIPDLMQPSQRNIPVDIAKGICIILVVFGHSQLDRHIPGVHATLSLVRMPLFFFLSGVFFSSLATPSNFLIRKTDALLKPYFVTLGIVVIVSILAGHPRIMDTIIGILYGNGQTMPKYWMPLWFLPHLWIVVMTAFALHRITKIGEISLTAQLIVALSMLIIYAPFIGVFMIIEMPGMDGVLNTTGLPFSLDVLPITLAYFLAGSALHSQVKAFKPTTYLVILSLLLYAIIIHFTAAHLDLHSRQFAVPMWGILGSLAGLYLMLSVAYLLSKVPVLSKWLITIGYSSLFILLFHGLIKSLTYRPFVQLIGKENKVLAAALIFILSFTLPLAIKWVVERNAVLRKMYLLIHRKDKDK